MTTLDSANGARNSIAYKKLEEELQKHASYGPEVTVTPISPASMEQVAFLVNSSMSDCWTQVGKEMRARIRSAAAKLDPTTICPHFTVEYAHICNTNHNGDYERSNG